MGDSMSRFGLCVRFTTHPGQRDALVQELLEAATLAESHPGCELYVVSTAPSDANTVWVTEAWTSKAAHDASLTDERAKAMIARALPLLAGPPQTVEMQPVGGKGLTRA